MTPERRAYIETALMIAEDFPDGAWSGFIFHEKEIDPEELVELQRIQDAEEGGDDNDPSRS